MARPKKGAKGKAPAPLKTVGFKASEEWSEWLAPAGQALSARPTPASSTEPTRGWDQRGEGFEETPPERTP